MLMDFKIVLSWIFCLLRTWNWYVGMNHRLIFWSSEKLIDSISKDQTLSIIALYSTFLRVPTDQY